MKAPFKIDWVYITPTKAQEWLALNTRNRLLRDTTVDAYSRDMLGGAWLPNHQGIAFAEDGRLLDGQHRLSAIVQSGCTIPMLVCTGVPDRGAKGAVMNTVDRGLVRSIPDLLRLEHGMKSDANMISAACSIIAQLVVGNPDKVKRLSVAQVLGILEQFQPGLKFVSENRPTINGIRSATCCGAIAVAYMAAPEITADFYRRFATGAGLQQGDSILAVREYFMRGDARETVWNKRQNAELLLHCVHAFSQGEGVTRMPRPESRPGAAILLSKVTVQAGVVRALFLDALTPTEPKREAVQAREAKTEPAAPAHSIARPLTAADVKLTPLAESLLRAKDVSERIRRKVGDPS